MDISTEVKKIDVVEKIRQSYNRNRGVLALVKQETGYDLRFIRQTVRRFREAIPRDEAKAAAELLVKDLMLGRSERTQRIRDMIKALDSREQIYVSYCCETPLRTRVDGDIDPKTLKPITQEFVCMKCGAGSNPRKIDRVHVFELKQSLIKQLLEEDEKFVGFLQRLGIVGDGMPIEGQPGAIGSGSYKPNILVIQGADGKQMELAQDVSKLDPIDAEKLVKSIERRLFEDDKLREKLEKKEGSDAGRVSEGQPGTEGTKTIDQRGTGADNKL